MVPNSTARQPLHRLGRCTKAGLTGNSRQTAAAGPLPTMRRPPAFLRAILLMQVHASVFKAYDIRGIVDKTIDEQFALHLGRAFGSEALAAGERAVAVGRDGRHSGPVLA